MIMYMESSAPGVELDVPRSIDKKFLTEYCTDIINAVKPYGVEQVDCEIDIINGDKIDKYNYTCAETEIPALKQRYQRVTLLKNIFLYFPVMINMKRNYSAQIFGTIEHK